MASSEENEVYESWEELDDSGILDRKLSVLQKTKTAEEIEKSSNGGLVILDDSARQFYGPPDPKVKILKRPTNVSEGNQVNGDSRPRQHKTLQQREQEYAEARLRILGEARSPEESAPPSMNNIDGINRLQSKLEVLRTSEQDNVGQGSPNDIRLNKIGSSDTAENVIRTPKGPDGTKGFNRR